MRKVFAHIDGQFFGKSFRNAGNTKIGSFFSFNLWIIVTIIKGNNHLDI